MRSVGGGDNPVEGDDVTNHWCSREIKPNLKCFLCCLEIRLKF